MKLLAIAVILSSLLSAQYTRRRTTPGTTKPGDITGQMVVTFHGKLKGMSKKEITIETEDQPLFNIGRTGKTKFTKDGKTIKPEEIPIDAALTIDVKKDPDLNPQAVLVMVDMPGAKGAEQK